MKIRKGTGAALEIIGKLKEVPVIRTTSKGTAVANIVLAVDEVKKNEEGNTEEHTEWHRFAIWGKSALFIEKYGRPGLRLRVIANVRNEKEDVYSETGEKYSMMVPKFHAAEVEPMDGLRTREVELVEQSNA